MPNNRAQSDPAAVVIEKDSNAYPHLCLFLENFWLYHRPTVDDYEEERQQPSMKAWHIVKYLNSDTSSFINKVTAPSQSDCVCMQGYKVKIGDIIKFGRVRFKVIMLCNSFDGDQVYQPALDLLSQKKKQRNKQTGQNTDSEEDEEEAEGGGQQRRRQNRVRESRGNEQNEDEEYDDEIEGAIDDGLDSPERSGIIRR